MGPQFEVTTLKGLRARITIGGIPQRIYTRSDGMPVVEAKLGQPFVVEVMNLAARVEVILTMDGRNTLKNEEGSKINNKGLIVEQGGHWTPFMGFRTGPETFDQFVFTDPGMGVGDQLLATATGEAPEVANRNRGVIGIAAHGGLDLTQFYQDYQLRQPRQANRPPASYQETFSNEEIPAFNMRATPGASVGAGETQHLRMRTVPFTRDGRPPEEIRIRYATIPQLKAWGLIFDDEPDPFPGDRPEPTGYGDAFYKKVIP